MIRRLLRLAAAGAIYLSLLFVGDVSGQRAPGSLLLDAPVITAVVPGSPCANDQPMPLIVQGSNFAAGLHVSLGFPRGGTAVLQGDRILNVSAASFTVLAEFPESGNYTLRVHNLDGGVSGSLIVPVQNCLTISQLAPTPIYARSTPRIVTLTGGGFVSGVTALITRPNGSGYGVSGPDVVSVQPNAVQVRLILPNSGTWRIVLRNSNGDLSNTQSFFVETSPLFDFDGDGAADVAIFRPAVGEWWYRRSSDGQAAAAQFGTASDIVVPGDYTGDGKADIAFFRPSVSEWFILRSDDGSFYSFPFGSVGDIPVAGDFDSDGKADTAVFRPSTGTFIIIRSSDLAAIFIPFGQNGDRPLTGDFDGDGIVDVAVFRPSTSEWWIRGSIGGIIIFAFGSPGDLVFAGDFSGGGMADAAFFRPSTGEWFIVRSENSTFYSFPFGSTGDLPVPADYDGDGTTDAAVFRPSSATWFMLGSTSGTQIIPFGIASDRPVPNAFVR